FFKSAHPTGLACTGAGHITAVATSPMANRFERNFMVALLKLPVFLYHQDAQQALVHHRPTARRGCPDRLRDILSSARDSANRRDVLAAALEPPGTPSATRVGRGRALHRERSAHGLHGGRRDDGCPPSPIT